MAVIEQRGNGHRVRVRIKGAPPQTATFERLTDARKWAQQVEAAIHEGRHLRTSEARKHTLGQLIDRYTEQVLPQKPKSEDVQKTQLKWWKDQLGLYFLSDVTPARLAECRDKLANTKVEGDKSRAPSTVNRYLAALSHAFTVAVKEWGWLDDNPMRKVTKPKEPKGRVRFLSDDERVRLLAACKTSECPILYPVVVLALSTGMRYSEVMTLVWSDVDLTKGRITLRETKNGEQRNVPLTGHAYQQINKLAKIRRIDTNLVFPNEHRGERARPYIIRKSWLGAVKIAQLSDFHFHDLRHSTASYLAMNGASLPEIAEVLGHKTLQMVKRYTHLSETHTANIVRVLDEKLFGAVESANI